MLHLANAVQPLFRLWWYPAEAAGEANAGVVQAQVTRGSRRRGSSSTPIAVRWAPYLMDERVSAADFYLTMLMRWSRNMPRPAHEWPHLGALARRMKARPSCQTLYEREGLSEWA